MYVQCNRAIETLTVQTTILASLSKHHHLSWFFLWQKKNIKKKFKSREAESNHRPRDISTLPLQSPALPTELSRVSRDIMCQTSFISLSIYTLARRAQQTNGVLPPTAARCTCCIKSVILCHNHPRLYAWIVAKRELCGSPIYFDKKTQVVRGICEASWNLEAH